MVKPNQATCRTTLAWLGFTVPARVDTATPRTVLTRRISPKHAPFRWGLITTGPKINLLLKMPIVTLDQLLSLLSVSVELIHCVLKGCFLQERPEMVVLTNSSLQSRQQLFWILDALDVCIIAESDVGVDFFAWYSSLRFLTRFLGIPISYYR